MARQSNNQPWYEDAKLAEAAYTPGKEVEGYTVDSDISGQDYTTYVNPHGKATVAFAGTHANPFTSKASQRRKDFGADYSIVRGTIWDSQPFDESVSVVQKAVNKYGQPNVRATGHSLGGTKSFWASSKTGVKATGFNPGWTPYLNSDKKMNLKNAEAYVVPGDPIAASAYLEPGLKVNTIRNPEGLERIKSHFSTKSPASTLGRLKYAYDVASSIGEVHSIKNFTVNRKPVPSLAKEINRPAKALVPAKGFVNTQDTLIDNKPRLPTPNTATVTPVHKTPKPFHYGVPRSQWKRHHAANRVSRGNASNRQR